jgi:hypothetical protein
MIERREERKAKDEVGRGTTTTREAAGITTTPNTGQTARGKEGETETETGRQEETGKEIGQALLTLTLTLAPRRWSASTRARWFPLPRTTTS